MSTIAPLRQPLTELADYYGCSLAQLEKILQRLRITPRKGSLSMTQDKKLARYLAPVRRQTGN
jgi:hypothetical protein